MGLTETVLGFVGRQGVGMLVLVLSCGLKSEKLYGRLVSSMM